MLTEKIHEFRKKSFNQFQQVFDELCKEFIHLEGIKLGYFCGWDKDKNYADVLNAGLERDQRIGYTQAGSHRADLRITIHGQDAAEILSRGQQKLLVCALKIAQGYVFTRITGRKSIYLVDDLPAELDEKHRALLAKWLATMETQVFITGVDKDVLFYSWRGQQEVTPKLFHVEQGKIIEVS
jgi:DNA replication and repair protein RecF